MSTGVIREQTGNYPYGLFYAPAVGGLALTGIAPTRTVGGGSGVSGTLTHGSTITLTGSGFGTHSDYGGAQSFLCAGWHDVSNGSGNGGNITLGPTLEYPEQWTVPASGGHGPSGRYLRRVNPNESNYEGGGDWGLSQSGTAGVCLVSCWFRTAAKAIQQSGKFFRVYSDTSNFYTFQGAGRLAFGAACEGMSGTTTIWGSDDTFTGETWQRVDLLWQQDPNLVQGYLNGTLIWQRGSSLADPNDEQWIPNPWTGNGHSLGFGGYFDAADRNGGFGNDGNWDFCDLYVDYTYARVELGNNATFANCTQSELQIPVTWSATEIQFQLNRGGFALGASAWIHVIDSSNTVVATYAVTLGS